MEKKSGSTAWKKRIRTYFINIFDIRQDTMDADELREMMEENTVIHGSNMWILMLAILIASIGLNVNSTAVIIGAMLISPLMSGILTMGYSLAIRDLTMLRKASVSFGTQVIISLITSTIYFSLSPLTEATQEMIARTSPTLWDVLIALFGGIAGSIGNTRQKKSNVIPGVAIATALMPPLCTAGYGLTTGQLKFILGAFYLFTINTLFITLSAALVTKLLGIPCHQDVSVQKQKRINRIIAVITIVTVIPSMLVGAYTVYVSMLERNINDYLSKEFRFSDAQLVQSNVDNLNKVISVSLVGAPVSDEVIARLELELPQYNLEGYSLRITQNKSIDGEDTDKVTIAIQENRIQELEEQLKASQESVTDLESRLEMQIDCKLLTQTAMNIFPKFEDCYCGVLSGTDGDFLLLTGNVTADLTSEEEQIIKNWLISESGMAQVELQIKTTENENFPLEE